MLLNKFGEETFTAFTKLKKKNHVFLMNKAKGVLWVSLFVV